MSSIDAFFKACIEGDLKTVNLQISLGVKVNAVNRDGLTGLILAYKNSHSDIGSAILAAGGDAAYQGKASGDTALIWCCHNSLQGAALELIEKVHIPSLHCHCHAQFGLLLWLRIINNLLHGNTLLIVSCSPRYP